MGRQPTKKKIPQVTQKPQEPNIPASNPIQLKIKPTHCLMAHKMDGKQNYKQFRAKLKYPKVFRFDESAFGDRNYDTRSLWFLKLYRKTKYLQGFELIGAQTTRKGPMAKLIQRIPKVRSIKLQTFGLRSFESCPPGDRFSFIFKAFGRLNPSALHVRMASEFGIDNNNLSLFIQSVFRYIQTLSNLKSFSLILKRYLKIFGITSFSGNSDFAGKQNRLFRSVREQFKRLKKIEDLRLLFIAPPQSILEGFISSFTHLQKLRNIEVLSVDADQGKNIIESLSGLKFLESITLCNHFEPNDILYLVKKTPSLRNMIFKDEWKFANKKIPILSEINPKDVNIVKLHLNNPVNTDRQETVRFLVEFLSIFTKLQSLQLYVVCRNDVDPITDPIAKQINKFTHLESLTLGLCMATGFLASQFLSHIKDLNQLKKLTLMTKVTFEEVLTKSWGEQIEALLKVLTVFVLQSKNLVELRTFWGNFTQQISDGLITLVKKLGKLDVFELAYKHAFQNHGAGHDHVIEGLIKMLKQMNQTNDVSITTYCPMTGGKSCDKKAKKMYEIAENNPNIKKVYINLTTGIITPFEADL